VFYSSCDGGELFKSNARKHLADYLSGTAEVLGPRDGPFAAFELSRDFADEWYKSVQAGVAGKTTFSIKSLAQRLPYYAQFVKGAGRKANKIQATDIYFMYETSTAAAFGNSTFDGNPLNAGDSPFTNPVDTLTVMSFRSVAVSSDQWDFSFDYTATASATPAKRAWRHFILTSSSTAINRCRCSKARSALLQIASCESRRRYEISPSSAARMTIALLTCICRVSCVPL